MQSLRAPEAMPIGLSEESRALLVAANYYLWRYVAREINQKKSEKRKN